MQVPEAKAHKRAFIHTQSHIITGACICVCICECAVARKMCKIADRNCIHNELLCKDEHLCITKSLRKQLSTTIATTEKITCEDNCGN